MLGFGQRSLYLNLIFSLYILSICNVKALLEESLYWFWHYLYDARVNVSRCKLIHSMICPYISTLASIEDKVRLIFLFMFSVGCYYISLRGIISYWSSRRYIAHLTCFNNCTWSIYKSLALTFTKIFKIVIPYLLYWRMIHVFME